MRRIFTLRYNTAYFISILAIVSGVFATGVHLILFSLIPIMTYVFRRRDKVMLNKLEGNILAGIMTLVFIPLFFLQDVFLMAFYYLLGLLCIKLFVAFEEKDYDHVALLGFLAFSMSTVFLYSMWYVILFLFFAISIGFYLFLRYIPKNVKLSKSLVRYMLVCLIITTLFSLFLFFFLPRNPYMLFGAHALHSKGDFENLEIGKFDKSNLSGRVLLRVKSVKKDKVLYLRLRVFTRFDGKDWYSEGKNGKTLSNRVIIGLNPEYKAVMYRVYPAVRFTYIPLVEYPVLVSWNGSRFLFYKDLMELKLEKWPRKVSYKVFSISRPVIPFDVTSFENYTEIPKPIKDKLKNVVKSIKVSHDTLLSIIRYLRKNHAYGRFVPHIDTMLPIVEFLLYKRSGECTEFATSFVLLARYFGYRARLVAGFMSDEYSNMGGYYIVREEHAHAWAEVFKEGRWERYDPTPPINKSKNLFAIIREYYDFLQYLWFTRVVEYSYRDQIHMASKFMPYYWKLKGKVSKKLLIVLTFGIVIISLTLYIIYSLVLLPFPQRAVRRFMKYMSSKGFYKKKGETLLEFAKRSNDTLAIEFVKAYYSVKFGNRPSQHLHNIVRLL